MRHYPKLFLSFIAALLLLSGASSSSHQPKQASPISIPVIDLSSPDEDQLAQEISNACSTLGFFQVTSHGISPELCQRFRDQCARYFDLPHEQKLRWKRHGANSRGYFDDELTKQKRDWKECLDVGVPGSRDWGLKDDDVLNACLDGCNQFPTPEELAGFRDTVVEYFDACAQLSDRIARLMARGMGVPQDDPFLQDLKERHSSYLRTNYYAPCCDTEDASNDNHPLGISPHNDAGFLTVLLQDDGCHSLQALVNGNEWVTVRPHPGALTINTGDMAQVWSNGRYKAPLHRVLTSPHKKRYSAPFFYNPGYKTMVKPFATDNDVKYDPVLWGYFRAVRFAGDLTDLGVEIQIKDFETANETPSPHLARQASFYENKGYDVPFDVEGYRELIERYPE